MPKEKKTSKKEQDKSTVLIEEHFLSRMFLGFLIVTTISWAYNGYSRLMVEVDAQESISKATSGNSIERAAALEAFDSLDGSHYFGNHTEAKTILPHRIPTAEECDGTAPRTCLCESLPHCCNARAQWSQFCVGAAMLVGQTEEALLKATSDEERKNALAGIAFESKSANDIQSLLLEPGQKEEKAAIREALPAFSLFVELNAARFTFQKMNREKAFKCREDTLCLSGYIKAQQPGIFHYTSMRHANSRGEAINTASVQYLQQHLSLFLRAFKQDKVESDLAVTQTDIALLETLLEVRQNASGNGFLFSIHLTLATLLIGLFRWLSPRFTPRASETS